MDRDTESQVLLVDDKFDRREYKRKAFTILTIQCLVALAVVIVATLVTPITAFFRHNDWLLIADILIALICLILMLSLKKCRENPFLRYLNFFIFTLAGATATLVNNWYYGEEQLIGGFVLAALLCLTVMAFVAHLKFDVRVCGEVYPVTMVLFIVILVSFVFIKDMIRI